MKQRYLAGLLALAVPTFAAASDEGGVGARIHDASKQWLTLQRDQGMSSQGLGASTSVRRPMKATPDAGMEQPQAVGVMIRFADADAQALAMADQPPPEALLAAIKKVVGQSLHFHRAMTGGIHVFRFDMPLAASDVQDIIRELEALPEVQRATADFLLQRQGLSYDPHYDKQWNLRGPESGFPGGISADKAWDITHGSSNTVVAVVDTGVIPHPEFASRLLPGYDFVSDVTNSNDGNGRDSDATDPGDWADAGACGTNSPAHVSSWHGTHVAGIIGADGANYSGIAGVTWASRILPVRVLGKCGGSLSDIIDGLSWAAGSAVPGVPANPNPAQIINLSLSGYSPQGCDQAYQEAINRVLGTGALVVVAAGNSSQNANYYSPANCRGVFTVAAVDPYGEAASYSNLGYRVAMSAPGGDISWYGSAAYGILSTVSSSPREYAPWTWDWKFSEGTSMAAPHVSGAAALAHAVKPSLEGPEMALLLLASSRAFPQQTYCRSSGACGYGLTNARNLLEFAQSVDGLQLVYRFYNTDLNHYFMTGSGAEFSNINNGSAGAGWYSDGFFYAWSGPTDGAVPVCRFYGTPGVGPNSHFYTASAAECAQVKNDPGWTYEGIPFYAKLPSDGQCPSGSAPIYRAYNNRWMYNDSNHIYTASVAEYEWIQQQGWLGEGVRLCVAL